MYQLFKNTLLFSMMTYSGLSSAGGPLVLEGANGNTAVTYQNPNITVNIENGKLGALSNTAADALVQQALDLWNNVSTSTINLIIDEALIKLDVNQANFNNYLPSVDGTVFNADDNLNPVIYDDNGEIIDAYFGIGQSNDIVGFAASILFSGASYFSEGYTVINGKNLKSSNTTFKLLVAHEIGHFIGLDHSQVDINNQESGGQFCSTSSRDKYPVMYPFACRNVDSLHEDDISAISALYPGATVNTSLGTLNGRLTDQSGKVILGANMWVTNISTGNTYSIVSDYLKQSTGFYKLLLPAGNYTLYANSINTEFNGGSSVGPYSLTTNGLSFTCSNGIVPTYYEGNTPGNAEVITISANQTTVINFSLSAINIDTCAIAPPTTLSSNEKSSGALSVSSLSLLFLLLASYRLDRRTRQSSQASLK